MYKITVSYFRLFPQLPYNSVGVKYYRCCLSKTSLHNTDSITFSYEYDCIKHGSSEQP